MTDRFPEDFTWGVATSAYQIEGGREDGKGTSIWDTFAHHAGTILDGSTGDIACDHYHHWREDVDLMAALGVSAYRLSIAWTRVIPDGYGRINRTGLGFYDRLIDRLLLNGITPWVTLYHWDLPQALQDRGGWVERSTVDAFAIFAHAVADALGDRVKNWITINEPWVAAFAGHRDGIHAPGVKNWSAALTAGHHLLLAHGRAAEVIHDSVSGARVGIALDCRPVRPASDDPRDVAATRHMDGFRNRWFFDPVMGRDYPSDMVEGYRTRGRIDGDTPTFVHPGDMNVIGAPLDFLGINYYTALTVSAPNDETEDTGVPAGSPARPGHTEMGWPIHPNALRQHLLHLHTEYAPPEIVVTENGASYSDGPGDGGTIHDTRRIDYLRSHIQACLAARDDGVPLSGYFAWSLLDNFEWSLGFTQRFGLVWVDHETHDRTPKESFNWYSRVIRTGQVE